MITVYSLSGVIILLLVLLPQQVIFSGILAVSYTHLNDIKAVMTALKYLKNGEKISIFPEGTRNRTDADLLPLKGGAALFAIRAKAPIYPVMMDGKTRLFRRTRIVVGDPIDLTEFYDRKMTAEDYAKAEEIIRDKMLEIIHGFQAERAAKAEKKKKKK